jgi:transmembrane sensor
MDDNRLLDLIGRKLSGEASSEELKELEGLVQQQPELKHRIAILQQFWEQHDIVSPAAIEEALKKALQKIDLPVSTPVEYLPPVKRRSTRFILFRAAAAVVILLGCFLIWNKWQTPGKKETTLANASLSLVEKQNSKGVKSTIELPDGSKVWLNADSKIEYPEAFAGGSREVYLNGEAFFDVVKNPSKPFIIHLSNGTVRVLGTSFNIRAYENEKVIQTSVVTGKVAFIPKYERNSKKQDTLFITPENKVSYFLANEKVVAAVTISQEDKAWTEGKLIFKNMTFEQIAAELERNFGMKVVFVNDNPKAYRLTGSFQNNNLEEIMYYLQKTKEFNYKITDSALLIGDAESILPE